MPTDEGALVPALPYQDVDGQPMQVVPETADEFSLLQRFAIYSQPVRDRLLAFASRKDHLADVFKSLDAQQIQNYPNDYDSFLLNMLRKV